MLLLLTGLVGLQGCASLSRQECERGDWAALGYQDGMRGYRESRLEDHVRACSEYRIAPDVSDYRRGRQRGLQQVYCLPGSGYQQGLDGSRYRDVCPDGMAAGFLAAFRYGSEIHRLQAQASELGTEISERDERIEQLDKDIRKIRRKLRLLEDADRETSRQLKHALRGASRERDEERRLRDRLQRQLRRLTGAVWELKVNSPYR